MISWLECTARKSVIRDKEKNVGNKNVGCLLEGRFFIDKGALSCINKWSAITLGGRTVFDVAENRPYIDRV